MGKIFRKIKRTVIAEAVQKVKEERTETVTPVIKRNTNQKTLALRSSALEIARQKKREMVANGIADVRKNPLEKWEENKLSIRNSVNAKCYQCNGEENYRNRARFCNVFDCALWHIRPYGKGITKQQCLDYRED